MELYDAVIGSEMVVQLVPLPAAALQSIGAERPASSATHELLFQAARIPPLGHKSYYVLKTAAKRGARRQATRVHKPRIGERVSITNQVGSPSTPAKWPVFQHLTGR